MVSPRISMSFDEYADVQAKRRADAKAKARKLMAMAGREAPPADGEAVGEARPKRARGPADTARAAVKEAAARYVKKVLAGYRGRGDPALGALSDAALGGVVARAVRKVMAGWDAADSGVRPGPDGVIVSELPKCDAPTGATSKNRIKQYFAQYLAEATAAAAAATPARGP